MLGRFRRWMHVVFVSDSDLWITLAVVVTVWAGQWLVVSGLNRATPSNLDPGEAILFEVWPVHEVVLLVLAAAYGLFRGRRPHPLNHSSYGTWLAQTPWRWGQPPPLGPIQLVWQDAVVLGSMMVLSLLPPMREFSPLFIPAAFALTYCVLQAFPQLYLKVFWPTLALIGFVFLGLAMCESPFVVLLISAAMCGTTYLGLRRSLRDFPYTEEQRERLGLLPFEKLKPAAVPWQVVPEQTAADGRHDSRARQSGETFFWSLLAAVTIGAMMFFVAYLKRDEPFFNLNLLIAHGLLCGLFVLGRLGFYAAYHRPPISLAGRVATRRLLIPGYDVVYIAPLVTTAAAFALPAALLWIGITPIVAMPLATTATIWLAVALPPDYERWHYTGHYRVPEILGNRQTMIRV